ncbi:hypothetical protein IWQ60_005501 [Tieghemiomyces parasiticus]|uniref:Cytochrome P450 n=1 Tax=Tieghemiomyces parasiticus TaxID=78921 RepID=A0A9W8DY62_9FUNG|nr:hypothetical protein IWQ60_005501 [Tieghemiomyces parasiticus]
MGIGDFDLYYRDLTAKSFELTHQRHLKYGPIFRLGPESVSICDGKFAKEILSSHRFRKPKEIYSHVFQVFLPNIFTTADPDFHRQRKGLLAPVFTWANMLRIEGTVIETGIRPLLAKFHRIARANAADMSGKPVAVVNLYREFTNLTFDITGRLTFGRSFNTINADANQEVFDWFSGYFYYVAITRIFPFLNNRPMPLLPPVQRGYIGRRGIVNLAITTVRERLDYLKELDHAYPDREAAAIAGKVPHDILQLMIDARDNVADTSADKAPLHLNDSSAGPLKMGEGRCLSPEELASESLVQMVAGTETTSSALSWVVYALLSHPHHYQRLVDEVLTAFPLPVDATSDNVDIIRTDSIKARLPFLDAVIQETLRYYPSASTSIPRVIPEGGLDYGGYHVPAGYYVNIPLYATNRDPQLWSRPEEFIPERWLVPVHRPGHDSGSGATAMDPGVKIGIMTFLSGPRGCLGRNLALMELQLTLANLIRQFNWEFADPANSMLNPVEYITLRPESKELLVTLMPRMGHGHHWY